MACFQNGDNIPLYFRHTQSFVTQRKQVLFVLCFSWVLNPMKNVKKIVETRNESFSLFLHLHKQRDIQSTDIQVEIYHTHTKIISLHTQILQNRIKIYLFFHCIPHRKLIWIQNYVHSHTGATLSLRMNLQSNVINVETVLTTLQKENPLYIL